MTQQKAVLIAGGLGFIGTSVSERFLKAGWKVTIVDSLVSNVVAPAHFSTRNGAAIVEIASAQDYFSPTHPKFRFDLLIHAASVVGPAGILDYAGTIGDDLVHATSGLLHYCRTRDVPLIFFSSAEVYGHSGILEESMDARVPSNYNARLEYALGKLTCECMLINSKTRGLRTTIIRPFNVVGPRQSSKGGFVMPTMVQQALAGLPITVFESGQQTRAFTDVDDIVTFVFEHAANGLDSTHPIYNVGNPANTTTIEQLARLIKQLLGSSSEIVFTRGSVVFGPTYFEAESMHKIPEIRRAESLGWRPTSSLEQIILKTARFYRHYGDSRAPNARRPAA